MNLFHNIKRAFGFSSSDDDELEEEGIDATVTPLRHRNSVAAGTPVRPTAEESDNHVPVVSENTNSEPQGEFAEDFHPDPSVIFDRVVRVFNEALPGFLNSSVDPEKERRALFDALDASMKDYFTNLERNIEHKLKVRYENDKNRLHEQIDDLRQKAKKEEEGNTNAKNLQLSAERQKRALSERVHDLEKQIASLEAENEQYILENKTMANKLRLTALTESEGDTAVAEQLEALRMKETELQQKLEAASKKQADTESKLSAAETKQSEAEAKLTDSQAKLSEAEAKLAETERLKGDAEAEVELLKEAMEQAQTKDQISQAMVNDLNSRAASARQTAEDVKARFDELVKELQTVKEQKANVETRLAKAQSDLQVVKEVQEQVSQLEENQRMTDSKLRRQKDELLEKDELLRAKDADLMTKNTTLRAKEEKIRNLEEQTDGLRKSLESLRLEKSQSESSLLSEIERLKTMKGHASPVIVKEPDPEPVEEVVVEEPKLDLMLDLPDMEPIDEASLTPKPRRGRPPKAKKADEDAPAPKRSEKEVKDDHDLSLLDSTDWLIATPPTESASKPKRQRKQRAEIDDDSFGYKEPVRQMPPDNPAQMLLW